MHAPFSLVAFGLLLYKHDASTEPETA